MKKKLEISIDKSLDWIIDHLAYFNLPENTLEDNALLDIHRKRLAELAMSIIICKRNTTFSNDDRVQKIVAFVQKACNTKEFYYDLTRNANLFPFFLMLYNGLAAAGIELNEFKQHLQTIVDANFMGCLERTAWNQIDFKYHLDLHGIEHQMLSYEKMYEASSLFHLPNAIYTRNIDIYAITHILFHLTDFGENDIHQLLKDKKEPTEKYIGFLTAKYAFIEDWDLLGELLICCHNLHYREDPLFDDCWQKLLASQDESGFFTSRYIQKELKKGKKLNEKDQFDVNYHPTLVNLFACLLEHEFLNNAIQNEAS